MSAMPNISKDISIVTNRLELRAASIADIDLVWSASRFIGFNDWMVWDPPESKAELEVVARINDKEWHTGNSYVFTIVHSKLGLGIGRIAIRRQESPGEWNIGYWIHPDHWGRGYATEASAAILEFGRTELAAAKITVAHAIDNIASQKVIEKLGFERTGYNPRGFFKKGKPVPEYEYVIQFNTNK